jgi:glycosyltransferase involved in cell wall biosynthesis
MKKILLTSNTASSMLNFRQGLIKYLLKNGYQVYIVAPFDKATLNLQDLGCICVNIKLDRKGINPIKELKLIWDIYKIYKEIKPDIIFNYTIKPIIYGSLTARFLKIHNIAINIGLGYAFINKNIITQVSQSFYKIALKCADHVWFINADDRDEFVKRKFINMGKTLILPSEGINLNYFMPRKVDIKEKSFLLIARILWDKGIGEYYNAAKILRAKYPHIIFNLLGNIDLDNPQGIKPDIISKWHNEGVINYMGQTDDVRDFIADTMCVVLPSYREGKGMVLIEGGAMGKPLIATNVPGCKDVVKDGYNGFLCEVKDAVSLANAMEKIIILDEKSIEKLGKNSRQYMIENFDEKKVIKIYIDFLDEFYRQKDKK